MDIVRKGKTFYLFTNDNRKTEAYSIKKNELAKYLCLKH